MCSSRNCTHGKVLQLPQKTFVRVCSLVLDERYYVRSGIERVFSHLHEAHGGKFVRVRVSAHKTAVSPSAKPEKHSQGAAKASSVRSNTPLKRFCNYLTADGAVRCGFGIMSGMGRYFNIGGPCNPAKHYTLPAMARLPQVVSLIDKEQYFVVHAQRQCGKTTAFLALANEMNAKDEAVAIYCSLEAVQEFPEAERGVPKICALIRRAASVIPALGDLAEKEWPVDSLKPDDVVVSGVGVALSRDG